MGKTSTAAMQSLRARKDGEEKASTLDANKVRMSPSFFFVFVVVGLFFIFVPSSFRLTGDYSFGRLAFSVGKAIFHLGQIIAVRDAPTPENAGVCFLVPAAQATD
jgi:hypothetical protein